MANETAPYIFYRKGRHRNRPSSESVCKSHSLDRERVLRELLRRNSSPADQSNLTEVANTATGLSKNDQLRRIRVELARVKAHKAATDTPETVIPKHIKREIQFQTWKERASTVAVTTFSEGASFGAGIVGATHRLHESLPIQSGWALGVATALSYGAVWGALQVNEKANTRLLQKTGVGTDLFSKIGHEMVQDSKKLGARVGYWAWHSGWEAYYLFTTAAIGLASSWKDAASFSIAANTIGTGVILGKTAVTNWWVNTGRERWENIRSSMQRKKG